MAKKHAYKIDLQVGTDAKSRLAVQQFKDNITDAGGDLKYIQKAYKTVSNEMGNSNALQKEYIKALNKELKIYNAEEDAIVKLLSNEAKRDRLKYKELKDELKSKDITKERQEQLKKELGALETKYKKEKQFLLYSDKELKNALARNSASKTNIKMLQTNLKIEKSLAQLVTNDLKVIKEKVKEQFKFISALKTTEGRYKAIQKVMSKGATALKTTAKAGAIGGAAIAGAAIGGVISAADTYAQKDRALQSLKSGVDSSVVDEVFIKTGADYTSIVAAINNVADITKDKTQLVQAASMEVLNPGIGKLLLSQSSLKADNIAALNNIIMQVKKQTGAQDLTSAIEASMRSRSVTRGAVSQRDYLQAYSQLSGAGLDEEHINRIINSIANKGGNFVEQWNKTDLAKYVYDKQLRQRMRASDLSLTNITDTKQGTASDAQNIVEKMRELQVKKDELMVKLLPAISRIVDTLTNSFSESDLAKIGDGLVDLLSSVLPLMKPVFELLKPVLSLADVVLKALQPVLETLGNALENFSEYVIKPLINGIVKGIKNIFNGDDTPTLEQRAMGGIVHAPAIVGERGPELVLPLSADKLGRATNIVNNFTTTQNFNTNGVNTELALSQAVSNNRFIRHTKPF